MAPTILLLEGEKVCLAASIPSLISSPFRIGKKTAKSSVPLHFPDQTVWVYSYSNPPLLSLSLFTYSKRYSRRLYKE